ncbi:MULTISPECIES: hypothetical protein [Hydrocarboniphaga]|uniref:hypothetical protein n=1 Tax=Hydrocarboniphaga TaxID=243627 RepID=UPI0005906210|nr:MULTISPECIES: hypothetical protein [Hydrocarboniphaga]MDZ4078633.1 hypothetical protein [Hydrocarboniphaga sp.]
MTALVELRPEIAMKVVKEIHSLNHQVLAVRCDRCNCLVPQDAPPSESPARIDIDFGRHAAMFAADLCPRCAKDFLSFLAEWREVLRTVAKFDESKGYRYFEFQMLDVSLSPIRVQSLLDEADLR